jgi:predicted ATP-grasp superfamily ATP-dependent carboligase
VVREALDKRRSYALAERAGVGYPRTSYPRSADDLMLAREEFPVILKPAVKVRANAFIDAKAWRADDRDELILRYREALTMVEPEAIMLQDLIPGGNENQYSYAALCLDGVPIASLAARRLRQFPIEFGRTSSLVETIEAPDVEEAARSLLCAMRFTGLVEVEFKRDPRDGELKLLDINPRAWRWMALGFRAGVDFPYLMYRQCRGDRVASQRGVAGQRWVRMTTDPLAAAIEMWHGTTSPRAYLRSIRPPIEFSLYANDDPLPAFYELAVLAKRELRLGRLVGRFFPKIVERKAKSCGPRTLL